MSQINTYTAPRKPTGYQGKEIDLSKPVEAYSAMSQQHADVRACLFHMTDEQLLAVRKWVLEREAREAKAISEKLLEAAAEAQHAAKEIGS